MWGKPAIQSHLLGINHIKLGHVNFFQIFVLKAMRTRSKAAEEEKVEEIIINAENVEKIDEIVADQNVASIKLENINSAKAVTKIIQLKQQEKTTKIFSKVWKIPDLENLQITKFNLGCVSSDKLSILPSRLRTLNLAETGLGEDQILSLFSSIGRHEHLTSLSLEGEDLTVVDKNTLIAAVGKLERVVIKDCDIDTEQVETILECVNKHDSLAEVTIAGTEDNPVYLAEVTADLLASSVTSLQIACLRNAMVTIQQIETILKKVLKCSDRLRSLELNNLVEEDTENKITMAMLNPLASKVIKKLHNFRLS